VHVRELPDNDVDADNARAEAACCKMLNVVYIWVGTCRTDAADGCHDPSSSIIFESHPYDS